MDSPENQNQKVVEPDLDKIKTAAFFAFFPLTGIFGIHDILIKDYWKCILRIVIICLAVAFTFGFASDSHVVYTVVSILLIALYAWAFAEGFQILQMKQNLKNTPDVANEEHVSDDPKELEGKKEHVPVLPFIFSAVVFSYWGSTLFMDSQKIDWGGDTGLFFFNILIMPIYITLAVISIISGVKELKGKFRTLATISLVMVAISIVFAVRFFIWLPTVHYTH